MLTTLRIKNLALVVDLTLELQPGYNVITGETGAGKSILIGALNLVLGERADRSLIRSGADACSVEAVFDIEGLRAPLSSFLEENGLESCDQGQLVLKRSLTSSGTNRQFINGSPASLTALAAIGQWLVDIHGPHEHQSLLSPARQLFILDAFGKLTDEREAFGVLMRRREALKPRKVELIADEKTYAQQLDLLKFQIHEISSAGLTAGMDEEVELEYRRVSNAARLLQLTEAARNVLAESDTSLLTQAGAVGRTLQELARIDGTARVLVGSQEQLVGLLRDLLGELSRYADRIEVDPSRLVQLEEILNRIQTLKRKYGPGLSEVIAFEQEARGKLQGLESRDAELAQLNRELADCESKLLVSGKALSAKRRKAIAPLSRAITRQLGDLGFMQSQFEIAMTTTEHLSSSAPSGFDAVEFQFAPNPGEPLRPLRAIASSGELARVMLAHKTVLAAEDEIPVLIFDEVDANVGGETANAVGEKMRQIAQKRQVLCITHLPQVAAPASAHYLVSKHLSSGRTLTEVTLLDEPSRVTELARMLGGQSDVTRKHAQALLER